MRSKMLTCSLITTRLLAAASRNSLLCRLWLQALYKERLHWHFLGEHKLEAKRNVGTCSIPGNLLVRLAERQIPDSDESSWHRIDTRCRCSLSGRMEARSTVDFAVQVELRFQNRLRFRQPRYLDNQPA
jgi:hypothetical protein